MTQAAPAQAKIPTKSPQPAPRRGRSSGRGGKKASGPARARSSRPAPGASPPAAAARSSSWSAGSRCTRPGPRAAGGGRSGTRRASGSSARRRPRRSWPPSWRRSPSGSQADAPNMRRPGADLIAHYLDPDRLPVKDRWSRKHADTQRRLCERFAAPVIAAVTCQDIKAEHTQKIVNAAPTAGEGDRVHRMISALVTAGIDGRLPHQPAPGQGPLAGRGPPAARASGHRGGGVGAMGRPRRDPVRRRHRQARPGPGRRGARGARRADGQHRRLQRAALGRAGRPDHRRRSTSAARVITVDRKVVEVGGRLYVEAPKNRKHRRTIYPRRTPAGYPLAERLAARIEQARAEQEAGTNPLGLIFPSPTRQVLALVQLRPARPGPGLPGGRLARRRRQRHVDLALPAARVLHHRPVHLEARPHRRVPHGRPRQLPHHARHVRRRHRRRPRPRTHSH